MISIHITFNVSYYRRIKEIVNQSKGSLLLELQQRSIEFNSIIDKHQNIRYGSSCLLSSNCFNIRLIHMCVH